MAASSNPSDLATALIAIGSALVGGLTSGFFTLRALRRQHNHELQMLVHRRSYKAARALLRSILALDRAVADWMGSPASLACATKVQDRYNDFARDLAAEGLELLDDELRARAEIHMRFGHQLVSVIASRRGIDAVGLQLLGVFRSHCVAVCRAPTAHIRQEASLPPYMRFDTKDVQAILAWGAQA